MKKRILSLIMTAVMTASFMVSPSAYAFNIERECGEVVVTVIDEETNELFKEPGKFGMTMVDDKWDASESNPYTVKNVPKNDAYCITYDPVNTNDDDYCYAIDSEKSIPLFYLNADEDAKDITIYMHKRPIENKAEYGTIIVTVIDEETNELFKEDGVNDDVNFWIMSSSAEGPSSFGFGGSSYNQFNSNISNPYTLNNALINESYKIIHLGYNHDGFTYMIDEEKSDNDFIYSSPEPKEVKIYMKKDIWADHNVDTQVPEPDTSEYGTVTVTVIDKETNELFKEHSKFGLMMADDNLTMLDDRWDTSGNNPYTIKNVPKDNKFFITYDNDFMRYDGYYYRIYDYRSFKFDEGEDTKNLTIYMEKQPIEIKPEYGTITVSVIDEETGELYNDENDITSVSFFKTPLDFPKEGQFGGTIQIDEWNIGQSNPHVIEQAETNYSYTLNYSMMFFNTQYTVDAEKIPETTFDYLSSEPKEIKLYIKKNKLADQNADTDTLENPDIQADKEYTFEDIRSMTTEEIQELFELKGVKNNRVHTSDNTQNNFLLDPMPYLKDNIPEDIYGSNEIIYRFDEEKVKRSLGLPDELFEITVEASMPIGLDDTPVQKYCECIIQPKTEDIQTRKELIAAAMNYVKLNPDYRDVGVFFELGGWENNVISTTNVSSSTTTTVTTTTAKQTSFEEPVSDSKTTTTIVKTLEGDVNCDDEVDMADAVLIMQALANPNKYGIDGTAEHHLTEQGKTNGDMNGDGLTVGDAQAIQKKLLGLDAPSELTLDKTVDWYHSNTAESFWDICFDGEYSAVITNTEELEVYLSKVLQDKAIKAYVDKYNDSFFKENVLLLDSIYQSAGMKAGYQIDNVDFSDDEISVSVVYAFSKGQALECVVSLCIAQVIVPKEAYNGQTVNWTIEKPYV